MASSASDSLSPPRPLYRGSRVKCDSTGISAKLVRSREDTANLYGCGKNLVKICAPVTGSGSRSGEPRGRWLLNLAPEFLTGVFGIELGELPQQLLGLLVSWDGNSDTDLDDFVAAG